MSEPIPQIHAKATAMVLQGGDSSTANINAVKPVFSSVYRPPSDDHLQTPEELSLFFKHLLISSLLCFVTLIVYFLVKFMQGYRPKSYQFGEEYDQDSPVLIYTTVMNPVIEAHLPSMLILNIVEFLILGIFFMWPNNPIRIHYQNASIHRRFRIRLLVFFEFSWLLISMGKNCIYLCEDSQDRAVAYFFSNQVQIQCVALTLFVSYNCFNTQCMSIRSIWIFTISYIMTLTRFSISNQELVVVAIAGGYVLHFWVIVVHGKACFAIDAHRSIGSWESKCIIMCCLLSVFFAVAMIVVFGDKFGATATVTRVLFLSWASEIVTIFATFLPHILLWNLTRKDTADAAIETSNADNNNNAQALSGLQTNNQSYTGTYSHVRTDDSEDNNAIKDVESTTASLFMTSLVSSCTSNVSSNISEWDVDTRSNVSDVCISEWEGREERGEGDGSMSNDRDRSLSEVSEERVVSALKGGSNYIYKHNGNSNGNNNDNGTTNYRKNHVLDKEYVSGAPPLKVQWAPDTV